MGTRVAVCCGSMAGTPQRTFRAVVWSWTRQSARTMALWAVTRTSSALTAAVFLLRPARLRWSETTGQACCGCGCVCLCVVVRLWLCLFVCMVVCVCLFVCGCNCIVVGFSFDKTVERSCVCCFR